MHIRIAGTSFLALLALRLFSTSATAQPLRGNHELQIQARGPVLH